MGLHSILLTIYAPMIYTAPYIIFWMRAYPLRGEVRGGWALEFLSYLGNKPIGEFHLELGGRGGGEEGVYLIAPIVGGGGGGCQGWLT
jgi:hypothetical protein